MIRPHNVIENPKLESYVERETVLRGTTKVCVGGKNVIKGEPGVTSKKKL